jgi:DNA-directed RNA polymerase subunit RPC12/RpoP
MPVTTLRCAACGAEFVDSRSALADGDEANCPKCGARNAFTPGFVDAVRRGESGIDLSAPVVHSEQALKKQD